jgi:hypothetical protein
VASRIGLLVTVLLVGCAHPPSAPTPARPVAVVAVPCSEPRFDVPSTVFVSCWPDAPCRKSFEVTVDNCMTAPLALKILLVDTRASGAEQIEFDPPLVIPAGTRHLLTYPIVPQELVLGAYHLFAILVPVEGGVERRTGIEAKFEVVDTAREKAQGECVARGDDWMFEQCEAVMPDAGQPCSDERECAGSCLLVGEVAVSRDANRVFGLCSRTRWGFGCRTYVGKTNGGLVSNQRKFFRRCT